MSMSRKSNSSQAPDDHLVAGQKHLELSSQILLTTSPALSSFLGSQKNVLSFIRNASPTDMDPGTNKQCQSCGYSLIPGWSCKKHRSRTDQVSRRGSNKTGVTTDRISKSADTKSANKECAWYECDLCHSITKFRLPEKTKSAISRTRQQAVPSNIPSVSTQKTAAETGNAPPVVPASTPCTVSSKPAAEGPAKKRAKKSKTGGLAALLAKSKSESASPSGFDLMDFMKTA